MSNARLLIAARVALVAELERAAGTNPCEADLSPGRVIVQGLLTDGMACHVEVHRVGPTDWVSVRVAGEATAWLSPVASSVLATGLDGLRREHDLARLQAQVAHLESRVTDLQQDASRHEGRARVEAARAAYWKENYEVESIDAEQERAEDSGGGYLVPDDLDEQREAACERRDAAARVLAEYGEAP